MVVIAIRLEAIASSLEAIAISNKKLLVAPGIATRSEKKLGWRPSLVGNGSHCYSVGGHHHHMTWCHRPRNDSAQGSGFCKPPRKAWPKPESAQGPHDGDPREMDQLTAEKGVVV